MDMDFLDILLSNRHASGLFFLAEMCGPNGNAFEETLDVDIVLEQKIFY